MPYPVKVQRPGPGWLKGLDKYIEVPKNEETSVRDAKTTVRNQGGNLGLVKDAAQDCGRGRK